MRTGRVGIALALALCAAVLHAPKAEAAEGPIGEVYVQRSKNVRPGDQAAIKVSCPPGRPVLSGGVTSSGSDIQVAVASNGAVDGPDDDRKPDDAWKGVVTNGSPFAVAMAVYAQCGSRSDRRYVKVLKDSYAVNPGASGHNRDDCPATWIVTGGGVVIRERTRLAPVTHTMPFDNSTDADAFRDDAWVISFLNSSDKRLHATMTVICADPDALGELGVAFTTVDNVGGGAAALTQGGAAVDCPAGYMALGGGVGETNTTSENQSVAAIFPTFTGDAAVGWWGYMNNHQPATALTFKVAAVCVDPYL